MTWETKSELQESERERAGSDLILLAAEEVEGPILKLWKVSRMDMGAYMCIARYVFIFHLAMSET